METPQLDILVGRTSGLQPWRRVMHATFGALVAGCLILLPIPRSWAVALLAVGLAFMASLDMVRLRVPELNAGFFRCFRYVASPRESTGIASSTWYTLGMLLTVAFFPRSAAVSGILVLALADPAASWVGRRWGRQRFMGATLEGTAVFAAVALAVLGARHGPAIAAAAAVAATLAERVSWPVDDNVSVPVVTAAVIAALSGGW